MNPSSNELLEGFCMAFFLLRLIAIGLDFIKIFLAS